MGTYTSILVNWVDSPGTGTPVDAADLNPYTYAINDLDTRVTALGHLTVTAKKTTNYTANPNEIVPVDTTGGSITITLPTAPAIGTQVGAQQVVRGGTNTVTLHTGGSDVFNTTGGPATWTLTLLNEDAFFQYSSSGVWILISDSVSLSQLDARYQAAGTYVGSVGNADGTIAVTGTATAPVVSAGPDLYSAGAGWAPNVYGYLFENMERDDANSTLIMNGVAARTQLVLLGLVPAGTYSTFKLYVTNTPSGGVITAALFSASTMASTSWARLGSGNVTPSIAAGLVSTSLAFTLSSPAFVMLQMVYTTTATTYDSFAASASGAAAAFLNPPSGAPVSAIGSGSTAPASTLNPTAITGYTLAAQKIWCALA